LIASTETEVTEGIVTIECKWIHEWIAEASLSVLAFQPQFHYRVVAQLIAEMINHTTVAKEVVVIARLSEAEILLLVDLKRKLVTDGPKTGMMMICALSVMSQAITLILAS
jgi:hypothetical protein